MPGTISDFFTTQKRPQKISACVSAMICACATFRKHYPRVFLRVACVLYIPSSSGLACSVSLCVLSEPSAPPPPPPSEVAVAVSEDSDVPLFLPSNNMAGTNGLMSVTLE